MRLRCLGKFRDVFFLRACPAYCPGERGSWPQSMAMMVCRAANEEYKVCLKCCHCERLSSLQQDHRALPEQQTVTSSLRPHSQSPQVGHFLPLPFFASNTLLTCSDTKHASIRQHHRCVPWCIVRRQSWQRLRLPIIHPGNTHWRRTRVRCSLLGPRSRALWRPIVRNQ